MLTRLAAFVLLCLCAPALAQSTPAPAPAPAPLPAPATVRVVLQTAAGPIVLALETERAPVTARNFLRYVDARRFDGAPFYRALQMSGEGLVQAGIRDPARLYPPIAHEPTSRTGLSHVDGSVSMARGAAGSARSDFFIVVGDSMVGLDAGPNSGGDLLGFAVFGRVVEGMDTVRAIMASPVSPTEGGEAMRGQMLAPTIRILSARRAPPATPARP